jgi:hypothetical protein
VRLGELLRSSSNGRLVESNYTAGGNGMSEILVEVRPPIGDGNLGFVATQPLIKPLVDRVDDITEALKEISSRVGEGLSGFAQHTTRNFFVDEIELKFSIDLEAEAGAIIARTKAGAGFEATLRWKRNPGQ